MSKTIKPPSYRTQLALPRGTNRGLELNWLINEHQALTLYDSSRNARNGVLTDVVANGRLDLDGSTALATVARIAGLTDFTAWIQWNPDDITSIRSPLMDMGDFIIYQQDDDIIAGKVTDTYSDITATAATVLTVGARHDIFLTRIGNDYTLYVFDANGTLAIETFTNSDIALSALTNLTLGADSRPNFAFPLMADITNLSTDRALVIAASDDLRFSAGSPSLNSAVVAENWNGNQLTILMWVNLNFAPGDGLTHQLLANNVGGGSNNISVFIFTDGVLYFDVTDKDVLLHRFSSSITGWSVGTWHQVAVRLDFKNDEGELYVDGVSVDSTPTNPFSNDSMDTIAVTNLGQDSAQANQINGQISILAENISWTDAEISSDFDSGAGTPRVVGPYTILYDQFSDSLTGITFHPSGQGVTATDSGGNVTLDVTDAEKLYVVGEEANLEDATGFSASGPVLIESASGADVTIGSGIAHADLNGSSQFFSVSDAAFPATGLTGAQDLTIYAVIKPVNFSAIGTIVSKYGGSNKRMYWFFIDTNGDLNLAISSDGTSANTTTAIATNTNITAGIWTFVSVVYDASAGTADFYKNGILVEQVAGLKTSIADKDPDFMVGQETASGNIYNGSIAYVHLFSDKRTPAEIYEDAHDFDADLSGEGNLVCGYKFTEAAAAAAIDNVEGTAAGDIIPQDSGAVIYSGLRSVEQSYVQGIDKFSALEFDGSEDVDAGNDASLNWGTGNGSIAVWARHSLVAASEAHFLIKGAVAGGQKRYRLYTASGKAVMGIDDNTALKSAISDTVIGDGLWHHILGVRDGNNLRIYIDGIEDAAPTDITGYGDIDDTENCTIGAANTSGQQGDIGWFTGEVDEAQIFNIALTAADALWLATHPGADEAAIVANTSVTLGQMVLHHDYRNRNLIDVSSDGAGNLNGNDGTHSGTPSFVTTAHLTRNKWVDGNQEGGGIAPTIVGSNSVVTKDTSVVKFDVSSEKHVWTAADNNDEDTVATMALVSGNDYATRLWIRPDAMHDDSTIHIDYDGGATPILTREIGKSLDDRGNFARSFDLDNSISALAANNTVHDVTNEDVGAWAWVKSPAGAASQRILSKLTATGYEFYFDSSGNVTFLITDAGSDSYRIRGNVDLRDGNFHFVAAIVDRDNAANCQVYVDGVAVATTKIGTLGDVGSITSTAILTMGFQPGVGFAWDGEIAEAGVAYPADIMAAGEMGAAGEIAALFNNPGNPSAWPNSEDYWLCNDNAGNTTVTGAVNNLAASANTDTFATLLWKYYEMSFTADQQDVTVKIRILGAGPSTNTATVYLDQAEVIELVAGDALVADLYYTLFYDVDLDVTGSQWSGLGADATEVQAGDLYIRNDSRDANTATRTRDFADGKVDGMAVWNRGMNAAEVKRKRDFVFEGVK